MKLSVNNRIKSTTWVQFVAKHPRSNIFQTPEMYELYKLTTNYEPIILAAVNENDELQGVLLAVVQREHKGFLGKFSARSIIWGGPIIKDNNPTVLDFILVEYSKIIKGKAIYTQFRNQWEWSNEEKEVFKQNGFRFEEHLDIFISLKTTGDSLLNGMHQGRRKNIRRAQRIPLEFTEIVEHKDLMDCVQMIKKTYNRVGLPCPDSHFFINAQEKFKGTEGLKIFAARYHGEIIACRFVLCHNKLIYDWYAGAHEEHIDKYPNDFLPFKVMEWGISNGYELFDFGGAGKPNVNYGVRDFKLKFGGKLVNWGRFNNVHKPFLMFLGVTGIHFFKLIKNVWPVKNRNQRDFVVFKTKN